MPPRRLSRQTPASAEPGGPPTGPHPRARPFFRPPAAHRPPCGLSGPLLTTKRPPAAAWPAPSPARAALNLPLAARHQAARTRASEGSARAGYGLGCGRARTLAARAYHKVEDKLANVEGVGGKDEEKLGARLGLQEELLHLWGGGWSAGESLSSLQSTRVPQGTGTWARLEDDRLHTMG